MTENDSSDTTRLDDATARVDEADARSGTRC